MERNGVLYPRGLGQSMTRVQPREGTQNWGSVCCSDMSLSHIQLFATPWTAARQTSLSFTISWSLLKLVTLESVMSSNHPILCHPLLFLPSIFPSIKIFSNELTLCVRWPKYWSFTISPSSEHSGLISFRIDRFDLLASPRDSKEPPPTPQFESISSSVLSLLYGPPYKTDDRPTLRLF